MLSLKLVGKTEKPDNNYHLVNSNLNVSTVVQRPYDPESFMGFSEIGVEYVYYLN